tara:strand:+ start:530 stop:802 length:273 start_codon:yes stop_codon:yes gene_type:complete
MLPALNRCCPREADEETKNMKKIKNKLRILEAMQEKIFDEMRLLQEELDNVQEEISFCEGEIARGQLYTESELEYQKLLFNNLMKAGKWD